MLKLNTDEIKNLQFEVSIQGINYDELQGSLKFMIEDIEYGIPVKIQKDLVSVEVPPLQEIVAKGMKQGDVVECKLDIFGNGFYINPWGGQFELQTPVKVETTNINVETKPINKKVIAELKKVQSKQELDNEAILEMLFEKLEEKGFKIPKSNEIVYPEIKPKVAKSIIKSKPVSVNEATSLSREDLVKQKIKEKFSQVNGLIKSVKSLTEGKKVIRNPKIKQPGFTQSPLNEEQSILDKIEQLKNRTSSNQSNHSYEKVEQSIVVDKDDPIFLMESVGMKNPKIQQVMIEKAKELGGDGSKSLAATLKKLLGINEESNSFDQYMNLKARHDQ